MQFLLDFELIVIFILIAAMIFNNKLPSLFSGIAAMIYVGREIIVQMLTADGNSLVKSFDGVVTQFIVYSLAIAALLYDYTVQPLVVVIKEELDTQDRQIDHMEFRVKSLKRTVLPGER